MEVGVSGSHSHNLPADVEIVVTLVQHTEDKLKISEHDSGSVDY